MPLALRQHVQLMPRRFDVPWRKPDANCVLNLSMQDQAIATPLKDRSGYGNDGTITGAVWIRLPSGLWVLDCDGTDDFVALSALDLSAINFSISFWLKPSAAALTLERTLIGMFGATTGWQIRFRSTGSGLLFDSRTAAGSAFTLVTSSLVSTAYQHVVFTRNGAAGKFYFNGVDVTDATANVQNPMDYSASDPFRIARNYAATYEAFGLALLEIVVSVWALAQVASKYQQERHLFNV